MVESDDRLAGSISALSLLLLSDETLATVLDRVVGLARDVVPGCDHASVTMAGDRRPSTTTATDDIARQADRIQFESDEGPGLRAIKLSQRARIDDLTCDGRCPTFSERAVGLGIKSALSLPLVVREQTFAALNLYGDDAGAFTDDSERLAARFAAEAAVALANVQVHMEALALIEQLNEALTSRAIIERAKGILMARERFGAERAFDILRRASQRQNRKVRDIADEIVAAAEALAAHERPQH